ncbi:MAG: hypothetical protein J0J04_08000 [Microbacterium sp.]|uniref:hypothetical protein n=1 Tax=Microbacterium sp. TaxID=51671 RepID=UPI001AC210A7|nr:hypothetical protein [Microbacterium sp.]MBN9214742.1 hypothetical protein [Microbacterium sp.]
MADQDTAPTLGEIAQGFRELREAGVTRESALYALNQVWWEDAPAGASGDVPLERSRARAARAATVTEIVDVAALIADENATRARSGSTEERFAAKAVSDAFAAFAKRLEGIS